MSNMFKDAFNVMTGKDLEKSPKATTTTKSAKGSGKKSGSKKAETRKPVAREDARFDAFEYACNSEKLSGDIKATLRDEKGAMSQDLINLIQVLCDKPAVREMMLAQGDVRELPVSPDKIELKYKFVHNGEDDKDCTEEAMALIETGKTVEELEAFNLILVVNRVNKDNGKFISEGDEADYEKIKKELSKKDDK